MDPTLDPQVKHPAHQDETENPDYLVNRKIIRLILKQKKGDPKSKPGKLR